jgi:ABC-type Fe3+/spermidine/putrescine transport system ATPase subunit
MPPVLELNDVVKRYGGVSVLDGLSLSVSPGEYVTVLGPSGSGKSTMLRVIAGIDPLDAGEIRLSGTPMRGLPPHARGVGFVFQSFALFPHLSVFDNVAFGLRNRKANPVRDPAEVTRRVHAMLDLVGLRDLGQRLPSQISGGQKQRVAFARTLVCEPRLVLLDEPLGALDASLRERMMLELRRIHDQLGATFLHVTGNEEEALAMGGRVAVLSKGRIAQIADPETLIEAPGSREVASLLDCYNVLTGRMEAGSFTTCTGLSLRAPTAGAAGRASYCIRSDQVGVSDPGTAMSPGQVQVPARFLASEYSGARLTSLFDLGAGPSFEVEYHLGHRSPPALARDQLYTLHWPADRAIVFADA